MERRADAPCSSGQTGGGDKKSVPCGTLFFHMKNYLLQLDLAADFLDLLLQSLGILLGQTLLHGGGAPSTAALASARPRPMTSRMTLMTLIF